MDHFGNPESGGIHDCKHGFVFDVIDSVQQMVDFIGSQYNRKLVFLDHTRNHNVIPKDAQDIPVKKADGGIVKIQSGSFQPSVLFSKQKIPDILTGEFFRSLIYIIQEIRYIVFIAVNRTLFEVTDFSGFLKFF